MTLTGLMDLFSAWLDTVAGFVAELLARARHREALRLTEAAGGVFQLALSNGATMALRLDGPDGPDVPQAIAARLKDQPVELRLDGRRLLARPLELPKGAEPYLPGIVRAQIDRLTPWTAEEALYGWTAPQEAPGERIRLTVAATPRGAIAPLLSRLRGLAVGPISIVASLEEATGPTPVRLLEQHDGAPFEAGRIRKVLMGLLAGTALLAAATLVISDFVVRSLNEELAGIEQSTAATRRLLVAARDGLGADGPALRALERRKREAPITTLTLEDLSRVLPDDTYVTDLQISEDRARIAGVSAAPAGLVRLLEQSGHFTGATFVAPTTPVPHGHGERFDIEARIVPHSAPPDASKAGAAP